MSHSVPTRESTSRLYLQIFYVNSPGDATPVPIHLPHHISVHLVYCLMTCAAAGHSGHTALALWIPETKLYGFQAYGTLSWFCSAKHAIHLWWDRHGLLYGTPAVWSCGCGIISCTHTHTHTVNKVGKDKEWQILGELNYRWDIHHITKTVHTEHQKINLTCWHNVQVIACHNSSYILTTSSIFSHILGNMRM
jgi:hypothetical protein